MKAFSTQICLPILCGLPLLLCLPACTAPSSTTGSAPGAAPVANSFGTEVGRTALEIRGETADKVAVKLSQLQGQVVLVDFWATWCGPCRALIPHEKALTRQYKNRPFMILGISRDNKREDLKSFLDKEKLSWPNIFDGDGKICARWEIEALPTFVLIDHKGVVAGRWVGGDKMDEIEEAIARTVKAAEQEQLTMQAADVP